MSNELLKNIFFNNIPFKCITYINTINTPSTLYQIAYKISDNFNTLNFDINYYRFCVANNTKFKSYINPYSSIKDINIYKKMIIFGLDILPEHSINILLKKISNFDYANIIIFSTNINADINNSIKSYCNYYLLCKEYRIKDDKLYELYNLFNLIKAKKESVIFEYTNTNNKIQSLLEIKPYFGELKNIFEKKQEAVEHDTTFNVNITEQQLIDKNKVELPYINQKNLIEIDQEDIDEMYEEDPDEDLDI